MPCTLLEINIDLLWNNVLRAINSHIHNIHRYHGKLLADGCTSGSRIRALWHVITKQNWKFFWAHCTQGIQSYRKRICMLSQITLHISTHVHCMSQKHFHSHLVMSMFSLKVTRELPVGLLLVMCVRRDTVVTPTYTPPHVSGNRMGAGEKTNIPKWTQIHHPRNGTPPKNKDTFCSSTYELRVSFIQQNCSTELTL